MLPITSSRPLRLGHKKNSQQAGILRIAGHYEGKAQVERDVSHAKSLNSGVKLNVQSSANLFAISEWPSLPQEINILLVALRTSYERDFKLGRLPNSLLKKLLAEPAVFT